MTNRDNNLKKILDEAYKKWLEKLANSIINWEAEIKEIKATLWLIKEEKTAFWNQKQEDTLLSKLKEIGKN